MDKNLLKMFVLLLKMAGTKPSVKFVEYDAKQGDFAMAFGDADGGDVVVMKNWKGKAFVDVVLEVARRVIDWKNKAAAEKGLKNE